MHAARERLMTGSQIIETASGPIEYAMIGDGYPVLIIHGAGGGYNQGLLTSEAWVGDEFQRIAVSRFGYLRTPLPVDASPEAQADACADLLEVLNIPKVAIIGISAGGPSTLQFALRYPEQCAALIMISAISHQCPEETPIQKFAYNTMVQSDFFYWFLISYFQSKFIPLFGISQETYKKMSSAQKDSLSYFLKSIYPFTLRKNGTNNDRSFIVSKLDYPLERITAPTLVIHAKDDHQVLFTHAQHTAQNIPKTQLITIQKGGHMLIGQNAKVKQAVVEFLKQHMQVE